VSPNTAAQTKVFSRGSFSDLRHLRIGPNARAPSLSLVAINIRPFDSPIFTQHKQPQAVLKQDQTRWSQCAVERPYEDVAVGRPELALNSNLTLLPSSYFQPSTKKSNPYEKEEVIREWVQATIHHVQPVLKQISVPQPKSSPSANNHRPSSKRPSPLVSMHSRAPITRTPQSADPESRAGFQLDFR